MTDVGKEIGWNNQHWGRSFAWGMGRKNAETLGRMGKHFKKGDRWGGGLLGRSNGWTKKETIREFTKRERGRAHLRRERGEEPKKYSEKKTEEKGATRGRHDQTLSDIQ